MSDKSAEIVDGLILKPGAHGRRTYSTAAKRALVEICNRPGVSIARTALAHGINANLLRRWMVQYSLPRSATQVAPRPATILLPVESASPGAPRISSDLESCIEITFRASTIRVRGAVDPHALSVVLDVLARRT